jgi:hypothetical protein
MLENVYLGRKTGVTQMSVILDKNIIVVEN